MGIWVRFQNNGETSYGMVANGTVEEVRGNLFDDPQPSGRRFALDEVKLLVPCEPPKILAVGQNYISHLGERKMPAKPEIFYKPITSLQDPEGPIVLPDDCRRRSFRGRTGRGDGEDDPQCFAGGGGGRGLRRHVRQ